MNPESSTPTDRPPVAGINYLKLTLSLMAVVLFWHLIEHWDDAKAGFLDGFQAAQQADSR